MCGYHKLNQSRIKQITTKHWILFIMIIIIFLSYKASFILSISAIFETWIVFKSKNELEKKGIFFALFYTCKVFASDYKYKPN